MMEIAAWKWSKWYMITMAPKELYPWSHFMVPKNNNLLCANTVSKNWKKISKSLFKNCFKLANGWLLVSCTFKLNHQKICISFLWDLTLWLSEPQHWKFTLLEFVTHCSVIFSTNAITLNIKIHAGINQTMYSKGPQAVFLCLCHNLYLDQDHWASMHSNV